MAPYLDAAAGAETVYQFLRGAMIGTVWSVVSTTMARFGGFRFEAIRFNFA
jgi:hypothetical protein